jgi:phosphatidylglycerophosphate synthase
MTGDMPRRTLATRDTQWARALARLLARAGVQPNAVSIASVVCAAGAGVAFSFTPDLSGDRRAASLLFALAMIQMRLLCNLLDGMLAVEGGMQTRTGVIYNEVPDRVADVLILVAAGYSIRDLRIGPALGWAAAVMAVMTAYVRTLAGSLGVTQSFAGPMAKQHRMFALTVASALAAGEAILSLRPRAMAAGLVTITIGSIATVWRRTSRTAREIALNGSHDAAA